MVYDLDTKKKNSKNEQDLVIVTLRYAILTLKMTLDSFESGTIEFVILKNP